MIGKVCRKQTERHTTQKRKKQTKFIVTMCGCIIGKEGKEKQKFRQREKLFCCWHRNKSKASFNLRSGHYFSLSTEPLTHKQERERFL